MLIQLFTKTEPPIQIIVEGRKYNFKLNQKGDLICNVTQEHGRDLCEMFPNTYKKYDDGQPEPVTEIFGDDEDVEAILNGDKVKLEQIETQDQIPQVTNYADSTTADQGSTEDGKRPDIRSGHSRVPQRGTASGSKKRQTANTAARP